MSVIGLLDTMENSIPLCLTSTKPLGTVPTLKYLFFCEDGLILFSLPLTNKDWERMKPTLARGRGRSLGSGSKEQLT